MTNINDLIKIIKKELGLVGLLANIYDDGLIKDSIENVSLKEFNSFSGFWFTIDLESALVDNVKSTGAYSTMHMDFSIPYRNKTSNEIHCHLNDFVLDDVFGFGCEIQAVDLVRNTWVSNNNYSRGLKDDTRMMAGRELSRINSMNPRAEFRNPATVVLYDFIQNYSYSLQWRLKIKVSHPKNLSTITHGLFFYFKELCKCNVAIDIYNNELKFMNVNIGNSQVDLHLDNLANADSLKQEVMAKIREGGSWENCKLIPLNA